MHSPKYIDPVYRTSPFPAIAAGKTGKPQALTQGGVKGSGKITFAGNMEATDTVTINGVVFTAVAAGATGNQFDVGATLSDTLDNLVTVLNASVDPLVSIATYTKTGGSTELTATMDNYGTQYNGAGFPLAASDDGVSVTAVAGGQGNPGISLDTESTTVALTQAVDQNVSLAAGDEFQKHTIVLTAKGGAGNLVVTGNFSGANTTATFNAAGDFIVMQFLNGEWWVLVNNSVVMA